MSLENELFGVSLPEPDPIEVEQKVKKVEKSENKKQAIFEKTSTIRVKFPFSWEVVNGIKELKNRKFDPQTKDWLITIDFANVKSVIKFFNEHDFYVHSEVKKMLDFANSEADDVSKREVNSEVKLLPVPKTIQATLRPYQIEGFSSMVHWGKSLNGCEMGLGKTLQAITAIEYQKGYPCVVVCPASLKFNWRNEISRFLPNRKVQVLDGKTKPNRGYDFYIINYDNLVKQKDNLERYQLKGAIVDESHYIKNKKAKRSKATMELVKNVPFAHLLSGTPIENRPSEIISQIETIEKMPLFGGYWGFVKRYCNAKRGRFGLDVSGASNIEELHVRMSKYFYFRRNKADVLKDLPAKVYSTIPVDISNWEEYSSAENDLVNYLKRDITKKEDFKQATKGMTKDEKIEYVNLLAEETEGKVNRAEHLVLITTLRKVAAKGKIEGAKEWVADFFESNPKEKLLIFAWHTEVVIEMAKEFDCESIHGGVDVKKRQDIVDRFQNDPNSKILVLNIKAGGVGLNLTKASNVLFIEEPYNPALKLQAEDRAHRIGQLNSVNIYTLVGEGTIDEEIRSLIEEKLTIINSVNAGKFEDMSDDLDITKQLLEKLKNR